MNRTHRLAHAIADAIPSLDALRQVWWRMQTRRRLAQWSEADDQAARLYSAWIGPGDLVFDIGANVGLRTRVFSRLAGAVVAVEPEPRALALLRANARKWPNVTVEGCACGAEPGHAQLRAPYNTVLASLSPDFVEDVQTSGRFHDIRWNRSYRVEVETLDGLIARHGRPAFVKIDVEGFEQQVLAGLSEPLPALSFEVTAERLEQAEACLLRSERLGSYRYGFSHGETLHLAVQNFDAIGMMSWLAAACHHDPMLRGDIYAAATISLRTHVTDTAAGES